MIRQLEIEGFRAFPRFTLSGLGRVNLLVGKNNSGKTSVLEAVEALAAAGDLRVFTTAMLRRGEQTVNESGSRRSRELEIGALFHGFRVRPGVSFAVRSLNGASARCMRARIVEADERQQELFDPDDEDASGPLALELGWQGLKQDVDERLRLTASGGLSLGGSQRFSHGGPIREDEDRSRFITPAALSSDDVIALFEQLVLTPEEDQVVEALKSIEPTIERIASIGSERRGQYPTSAARAGIVLRCAGTAQRIPIGSMGDGVWRMLGLALGLATSAGATLLVDEIDTGLHFTAMSDMWRLVLDTAARLDVQVFATTHNSDCWTSLAAVCRSSERLEEEATIQRVERDKQFAVAFSRREMIIAADRRIEVR